MADDKMSAELFLADARAAFVQADTLAAMASAERLGQHDQSMLREKSQQHRYLGQALERAANTITALQREADEARAAFANMKNQRNIVYRAHSIMQAGEAEAREEASRLWEALIKARAALFAYRRDDPDRDLSPRWPLMEVIDAALSPTQQADDADDPCDCADRVKPGEYYLCPKCDAEWLADDAVQKEKQP